MTTSQKIFKLHGWLGLLNGIWLVILGASGALLVYYQEVDRWINRDILAVTPLDQRLSVDSLFKIVRHRHPEASGANIMWFPVDPGDCYSFRLYDMAEEKSIYFSWDLYQVDIDPYSGKILREGYYRDFTSFMHWMLTFHYSLHLGTPGVLIITIAGILLFANIVTGIIIYRKYVWKALIFKAPVQWKNWRTGSSGLHRYVGVWSIVFNILIFYSGLVMNWTVFDKETWQISEPLPGNKDPYINIDTLLDKVQGVYPGFRIRYLYIPFCKKFDAHGNEAIIAASGDIPGTPMIIPWGSSRVKFSASTGEVLESFNINEEIRNMDLWEKFQAVNYSFHTGSFAGHFSRVAYVIIGLSPGILALSGFSLWWRRKRKTWNL